MESQQSSSTSSFPLPGLSYSLILPFLPHCETPLLQYTWLLSHFQHSCCRLACSFSLFFSLPFLRVRLETPSLFVSSSIKLLFEGLLKDHELCSSARITHLPRHLPRYNLLSFSTLPQSALAITVLNSFFLMSFITSPIAFPSSPAILVSSHQSILLLPSLSFSCPLPEERPDPAADGCFFCLPFEPSTPPLLPPRQLPMLFRPSSLLCHSKAISFVSSVDTLLLFDCSQCSPEGAHPLLSSFSSSLLSFVLFCSALIPKADEAIGGPKRATCVSVPFHLLRSSHDQSKTLTLLHLLLGLFHLVIVLI